MQELNLFLNKDIQVVGAKADKTRWQFCESIAEIIGTTTLYVSTRLKGFKTKDVEDLYLKGTQGSFNAKNTLYELIENCRVK